MKIEKINDNQIRCTLNSDDLATRQIKLSELAYGSEKAKNLFRDMMIQAQDECGFEADNLPLMIEAIPITADSIVLIITKVEDPEELDTHFSKFAPSLDDDSAHTPDIPAITGADDILDIFQKLCEGKLKKSSGTKKEKKSPATQPKTESTDEGEKPEIIRIFHFSDLDGVIDASRGLNNCYDGENTLYRDAAGQYLLVLHQAGCTPEDFNKVCNILSEYGRGKACTPAREAFFGEHGETIAKGRALQDLFQLA